MIKVLNPGLSTTVQDLGRFGHYHIGLPPSGPMDTFSHSAANLLVGNDINAATLEMTYVGGQYEFSDPGVIAITGADMEPRLNRELIPMWESITVKPGDVLSFTLLKAGARCYLAIHGGVDVPLVMGSRSTYALCSIGGFQGRPLAVGDEIPWGNPAAQGSTPIKRKMPSQWRPHYSTTSEVRVVVGLCSYKVTPDSLNEFFSTEWVVTPEANRVGYRHRGIHLNFVERSQPFGAGSNPSNVVDLGYPIGSIQVPDGVEPIVLLKDAVTGGGYTTIGTVISPDLDIIGQSRTNSKIHFRRVELEQALEARKTYQMRWQRLHTLLEEE